MKEENSIHVGIDYIHRKDSHLSKSSTNKKILYKGNKGFFAKILNLPPHEAKHSLQVLLSFVSCRKPLPPLSSRPLTVSFLIRASGKESHSQAGSARALKTLSGGDHAVQRGLLLHSLFRVEVSV